MPAADYVHCIGFILEPRPRNDVQKLGTPLRRGRGGRLTVAAAGERRVERAEGGGGQRPLQLMLARARLQGEQRAASLSELTMSLSHDKVECFG